MSAWRNSRRSPRPGAQAVAVAADVLLAVGSCESLVPAAKALLATLAKLLTPARVPGAAVRVGLSVRRSGPCRPRPHPLPLLQPGRCAPHTCDTCRVQACERLRPTGCMGRARLRWRPRPMTWLCAQPRTRERSRAPCRRRCSRTRWRSCCPCCCCRPSACARWTPRRSRASFTITATEWQPCFRVGWCACGPPADQPARARALCAALRGGTGLSAAARRCVRAGRHLPCGGRARGGQSGRAVVPGPGALCRGGAAQDGRRLCAPPCCACRGRDLLRAPTELCDASAAARRFTLHSSARWACLSSLARTTRAPQLCL